MFLAYDDNKFLNKLLLCILVSFFLILIGISPFFSKCYGSDDKKSVDFTIDSKDYTVILPSGYGVDYNYYFITYGFNSGGVVLSLYASSTPCSVDYSRGVLFPTDGGILYSSLIKGYGNNSTTVDVSSHTLDDGFFSKSVNGILYSPTSSDFISSNYNFYDVEGNLVFENTDFEKPSFITSKEELSSGKFDTLKIDAGDFDTGTENLVLRISDVYEMGDGILADYEFKLIPLNRNTDFIKISDLNVFYHIPQAKLGIDISNGKSYRFDLCNSSKTEFYDDVTFTIGGLTSSEEVENAEDEQTEAIKENTEINKRNLGNY